MSANRKIETTNTSAASKSPGLRKPPERLAPLARYGVGAPPKGPNDVATNKTGRKIFTVVKAPENKPTVRQRMDQAAAKTASQIQKDSISSGVQIEKFREDLLLLESGLSSKQAELEQLNSAKQNMILAKEKYQKEEEEIQAKIKKLDKQNKESVELTVARRTENSQLVNKEITLKGKLEELSRFEE